MQDELFQRQWNAHHDVITAGLKSGLRHCEAAGQAPQVPIGRTYGEPVVEEDPPVAIGARVFAAGVATALLWVTVITFATPTGIPFVV